MVQPVKDPVLEVHDLTVSYAQRPVLWGIDFSLPKGSIAAIIGPNGAGKSTLLKAIMNLVPKSSGYVKLFGRDLNEVRRQVSYVPQRESVDWDFPASVRDVVTMGRYGKSGLFKKPGKKDMETVDNCLEKVGMSAFANRQIGQLSGGQQQRVFLARALAQEADFYLMDEPFAGVDAATESAIVTILKEMAAHHKTIIVVHHDLQSAAQYFNWIVLLNMSLIASGPTAEVFNNQTIRQTYGGQLSLLADLSHEVKQQQFPLRENK